MSMEACTGKIIDLVQKRYDAAESIHRESEDKISKAASQTYPQLGSWILPCQKLVGSEVTLAEKMIADDSWRFQWFQATSEYTCRCKFFKTHRLPCKHLFIKDLNADRGWFK
jgi:hypothetical protein